MTILDAIRLFEENKKSCERDIDMYRDDLWDDPDDETAREELAETTNRRDAILYALRAMMRDVRNEKVHCNHCQRLFSTFDEQYTTIDVSHNPVSYNRIYYCENCWHKVEKYYNAHTKEIYE